MAGEVRVLELRTPMGQWLLRLTDTGSPGSWVGAHTSNRQAHIRGFFISISKGSSLLLLVSMGKSEGISLLETAHQGVRACLGAGQHPLQAPASCPLCLAGDRAAPPTTSQWEPKDSEVKAGGRHS